MPQPPPKRGNPNGFRAVAALGNAKAREVLKAKADARAEAFREVLSDVDPKRRLSAHQLAEALNQREVPTVGMGLRGWSPAGVLRLWRRLGMVPHHTLLKEEAKRKRRAVQRKERIKRRETIPPNSERHYRMYEFRRHLVGDTPPGAIEERLEEIRERAGRPPSWPQGSVRYSKRLNAFILLDGSAVSKAGVPLPGNPKAKERRRARTLKLAKTGAPEVYHPEFFDMLPALAVAEEAWAATERHRVELGVGFEPSP